MSRPNLQFTSSPIRGVTAVNDKNSTTSTIENQTLAFVPNARDQHSVRALAERELEHVAAAGHKRGIAPGNLGNTTK
jgi:hypothetical protein